MEIKMGLQEKYFNNMKYSSKKVELRLNDEKRRLLNLDDIIYFMLEPDRKKGLKTKIINLTTYKNFDEAVANIPMKFLSSINDTKEEYLNDLNKYYSKEEQEKYGVVAIEVEIQEKSCGMVVFENDNAILKVLLIHHNLGHWGLPKGHIEGDETEEETAIRETFEETGIYTKVVGDFRKVITYKPKENAVKDVVFFIGKAKNNNVVPQLKEVSEAGFIEINEALNLVSHEDERSLLESAIGCYK